MLKWMPSPTAIRRRRERWVLLLLMISLPLEAAVVCRGASVALAFGSYDVFSNRPLDSTATVEVTCSRDGGPRRTSVTVSLGASSHTGGVTVREMRPVGGVQPLAYNLFRDAARTSVWGETPGVDTVSRTIELANRTTGTLSFIIFGRIFAQQDVAAGGYQDRLVIGIDF